MYYLFQQIPNFIIYYNNRIEDYFFDRVILRLFSLNAGKFSSSQNYGTHWLFVTVMALLTLLRQEIFYTNRKPTFLTNKILYEGHSSFISFHLAHHLIKTVKTSEQYNVLYKSKKGAKKYYKSLRARHKKQNWQLSRIEL